MKRLFLFREARPAGSAVNIGKTLLQTVLFWLLFLGVIPYAICWLEGLLGLAELRFQLANREVIAGVLFAVAGSLGILSGVTMAKIGRGTPLPTDCARCLVIAGPYRYIRNPMAVAGLAQAVAVGIFVGSWSILAYVVCGCFLWNTFVRKWEENDLEMRFGEPYRHYRLQVPCWIPRLKPYRSSEHQGRGNKGR